MKEGRAVVGPPPALGGMHEKGLDYKGAYDGTGGAQELPVQRAVPELRGDKIDAHELGGHYMPGSPPPLSR